MLTPKEKGILLKAAKLVDIGQSWGGSCNVINHVAKDGCELSDKYSLFYEQEPRTSWLYNNPKLYNNPNWIMTDDEKREWRVMLLLWYAQCDGEL